MTKRKMPREISTGSMADIAFLLLIFFLVTATIETDAGIDRKLPPKNQLPPPKIPERNILRVALNKNNKIMVEGSIIEMGELKQLAINFLDNGGTKKGEEGHCNYCLGLRKKDLSDNPNKAVISLNSDRGARYAAYLTIQDQLGAAYIHLRNRESERLYGMNYEVLMSKYFDTKTPKHVKKMLKTKINQIRSMYPQKISEAETISN